MDYPHAGYEPSYTKVMSPPLVEEAPLEAAMGATSPQLGGKSSVSIALIALRAGGVQSRPLNCTPRAEGWWLKQTGWRCAVTAIETDGCAVKAIETYTP